MVLILDGEELVGTKQNRIVNTTILVAAGCEIVIPVSCVPHIAAAHIALISKTPSPGKYGPSIMTTSCGIASTG
jgi:hypothetical protein